MSQDNPMQPKVFIPKKIAVIVLGVLFLLVVLEAVLRLGGFIFVSLQEYKNRQAIYKKGSYRIMCLGESTTEGGGIGSSYPEELERILNERDMGVKFSVINMGRNCIDSNYIVSNLEANLNKYQPDMVIAMIGANDGGIEYYRDIPDAQTFLFKNIRAYAFLRTLWMHILHKIRREDKWARDRNKNITPVKPPRKIIRETLWDLMDAAPADIKEYIEKSRYYTMKGYVTKAQDVLLEAIKSDPRNDWLHIVLGKYFTEQAQYALAEKFFLKAITLNEKNEASYFELGLCYRLQHKLEEAENQFKKIIAFGQKKYEACIELGKIYREEGKNIQYEETFKEAIALRPETACAYVILGKFRKLEKRYVEAEVMFKKTIALEPDVDTVYIELGSTYIFLKKFDLAEAMFKKALLLNPYSEIALRSLAGLRQEMRDYQKARAYFAEAERFGNKKKSAYYDPLIWKNYRKIKCDLDKRGIKLVCMQYPMRSVKPLKEIFLKENNVIFVDNEKIFKEAVANEGSEQYFLDMFAGDFGHCTLKGNRLIAENAANVIAKEYFKK